jgi:membrane protein YdbS with pleckstrin-like domain
MAKLADLGQRTGYLALLVAIVAFAWALIAHFPSGATTIVAVSMAVATITLAPAIVLGYAVKAADREDREHGR